MAYIAAEARQELLDTLAEAADEVGVALAALGDAYEQLDERSADTLEEQLFRPVQATYGLAKRTHAGFAARHRLPEGTFKTAAPASPSTGVKELLELVEDALDQAERILVELQDSMSPVEVGDAEVRAGLAEVRAGLAELSGRPQRFVSMFGR